MEKECRTTTLLFAIYLVLLTWILLFKMQFSLDVLQMPVSKVNLIPLAGSAAADGRVNWDEVVSNIIVFLPVGAYLAALLPGKAFLRKLLPAFCLSLAYEALQFVFRIGVMDITDLLGNTLGAAAGILLYIGFAGLFRERAHKLMNIAALACTVAFSALLAVLIFANL